LGVRLVVSYADPAHGHHGGIYQAGNWVYLGRTHAEAAHRVRAGTSWHGRSASSKYGSRALQWLRDRVDPHARQPQY